MAVKICGTVVGRSAEAAAAPNMNACTQIQDKTCWDTHNTTHVRMCILIHMKDCMHVRGDHCGSGITAIHPPTHTHDTGVHTPKHIPAVHTNIQHVLDMWTNARVVYTQIKLLCLLFK